MKSKIYRGETRHARFKPERHAFKYNLYFFGIELQELENLNSFPLFFKRNKFSLFSLWDKDYLRPENSPIMDKLKALLQEKGEELKPKRVYLITTPRYLGYCFNPVSFYLCYDSDNRLAIVLAEVRNTFDEKHVYLTKREFNNSENQKFSSEFTKEFYVSPFFDVSGKYMLSVCEHDGSIDIRVNIISNKEVLFASQLKGKASPFSSPQLLYTFLLFPLSGWLTMTRIHWQALVLRFKRKLKIFPKTTSSQSELFPDQPNFFANLRISLIKFLAQKHS